MTKLNGHYQIALPWRQECVTLLNNRVVTERRLVYLKRKFERDAEFFDQYKEKINELLRNGFARKVPSDWKPGRSKVWIIQQESSVWFLTVLLGSVAYR